MAAPKRSRRQRSCSRLPHQLLARTFRELQAPDRLICSSVCSSWKQVVKNQYPHLKPYLPFVSRTESSKKQTGMLFVPCLLLSNDPNSKPNQLEHCNVLNLQTGERIKICGPEIKGRWFSTSCRGGGWLLTVSSNRDDDIRLVNPMTGALVQLPPALECYRRPQCLRVITSTSNPFDKKCLFLARTTSDFYGANAKLVFFRPGDKQWTSVEGSHRPFTDSIFYRGGFYGVDFSGHLYSIDKSHFQAREVIMLEPPLTAGSELGAVDYYLVELSGDFLLVQRFLELEPNYKFKLYKLKFGKEVRKEWIEIKNIGDFAILLGKHSSEAVPANGGLAGNSIYCLDDAGKICADSEIQFIDLNRKVWTDRHKAF